MQEGDDTPRDDLFSFIGDSALTIAFAVLGFVFVAWAVWRCL